MFDIFEIDETKKDSKDPNFIQGWDHRLFDVLQGWVNRRFHYGHSNCLTFAAEVQYALTGKTEIKDINIDPVENEKIAIIKAKEKFKELSKNNYEHDISGITYDTLEMGAPSFYQVNIVGKYVPVLDIGDMCLGLRIKDDCYFATKSGLGKKGGLMRVPLEPSDILWNP